MARKRVGDPAAAVILLAMLAALAIYLFSIPEVARQEILPPVVSYNNTWIDSAPGVIPVEDVISNYKKINLPSVTLDNTIRSEPALLSNQLSMSSGTYSLDTKTLTFDVSNGAVSEGKVSFVITGKGGDGNLEISLNGQSIYAASPALGERTNIILPTHLVQSGVNTLTFSVSPPGIKFWQKNSYAMSAVTLHTSQYSSDTSSMTQSFSISSSEVANAESATLDMYIIKSSTTATLNVNLNGVSVFRGTPPSTFSFDVPVNLLTSGQNQLTLSVDEGGTLGLNFIVLEVKTKTIEGGLNYFFTISSSDWRRVETGAYTCDMVIRKTTGSNTVVVQLNTHTSSYSFSGAQVTADVCDKLQEGSNQLSLSSDDPLTLSSISVGIRP